MTLTAESNDSAIGHDSSKHVSAEDVVRQSCGDENTLKYSIDRVASLMV